MDIINRLLEYKIKDNILQLLVNKSLMSRDHKTVEAAKKELRSNSGVIFINVMAPSKEGLYKVMAKTKTTIFVYEYNSRTEELIMKGERRNVVS